MKSVLLAALTATIALVPSPGRAECISVPSTTAQRLQGYALVFVADVLTIENVVQPQSYRRAIRFRAIEAFKGVERGERVVHFRTTAEDFQFRTGTRVLVYAVGEPGSYSTQCSPTRLVADNDPEVLQLRRLASAKK